jgi:hypothetical protein
VEDQVNRTILMTGATGETGRIKSDGVRTVTGRNPVGSAESAAAAAGAWRR